VATACDDPPMTMPAEADVPWNELRAAAQSPDLTACDLAPDDPRRAWLDLYLPICNGGRDRPYVVGHLGQSVDGFIATCTGDSNFVTGTENIRHLHRIRALCDAVIVGAETVASDDPKLTTRLVEGPSPLRVVLDPRRRLPATHRIFTDGEARTLRVSSAPVDAAVATTGGEVLGLHEELLLPGSVDDGLDLPALLRALETRGCRRLFVEGGGGTVSAFLEADLLDRLHLAVAPLIIGSGRPAIRLSARERLGDCLRPPARIYRMGEDVLYDFDLRCAPSPAGARAPAKGCEGIARIY
jgi:diaminohydroxyphosphoribosylaminopyrimidine deaminase / 5-amino-6-(5-phosphoribosylamino)uracil reductase